MAINFNKKSFVEKISILQANKDILCLGSDHNYWRVVVLDSEIEEQLQSEGVYFNVPTEWDSSEIFDLVALLGIKNTDY